MNTNSQLRLILLTLGIFAVLALTVLNLYSMYALHESTVNESKETWKKQAEEFVLSVRSRIQSPARPLSRIDMSDMLRRLNYGGELPDSFFESLRQMSDEPIFSDVFFVRSGTDPCRDNTGINWFNPETGNLEIIHEFPDAVCDGVGITRTRMKVLAEEYKWNIRFIYDSYRTANVAMFNASDRQIVGYLSLLIDRDYLVNEYLAREIDNRFGAGEETGATFWLHDWTKQEVLASNNPNARHDRWDHIERFPNMLEDWNIKITFSQLPQAAAARASLNRNLIFLGGGVFLLLGSLLLMYITAYRDRQLSMRQASFLANVTHELKTPLAVMQAAGENLEDGRVDSPERLRSYGKHIHTEAVRLRRMIDKLLDVARNEAGQLSIRKSAVDIKALTESLLEEQRNYLKQQGFDVHFSKDENVPAVELDSNTYETIFSNLIENAVKYSTDRKSISVKVYARNKSVYVEVEDQGVGIPKESQKYVFEKFYRVEDTLTARTKGHGLGLAIVKNLVLRNGGTISLRSEHGKGSVFILEFPAYSGEFEMKNNQPVNGTEKSKLKSEYVY